jgi:sulfite exporter TauE/SafE
MSEYEKFESSEKTTTGESATVEVRNIYEGWSCMGPVGAGRRSFNTFWGAILVGVGGTWLAANIFDIEDWGRWAWSVILILLGLWYLARATGRRSN